MRRRTFLTGTAAGAATLSVPSPARAAGPALPYTAGSFFRSRVTGAPVAAHATAAFHAFMASHPDQAGTDYPKITGITGTNQWGTTWSRGASTQPIWRLVGPGVRPETQILNTRGFHMADRVAARIPTGTQDRSVLLYDPVFGYSGFIADAVPHLDSRTVHCSASAVFWHASNGLDKRNPRSNSRRNFAGRGRIPDSSLIRPDLVQAGIANGTGLGHTLEMFFVETDSAAGFCHPMVGAESGQSGFGAEGLRIAIKPSVHLVARGLTGGALVIARTLQQHGCYLGDNSGSVSQLKGAQGATGYRPYAGTNVSPTCLSKLSWQDFFVLPEGWH